MQYAARDRASTLKPRWLGWWTVCCLAFAAEAQLVPDVERRDSNQQVEPAAGDVGPDVRAAESQAQAAREVLERMRRDAELWSLLARSKGVFIVSDASRTSTTLGKRDGKGVLFVNNGSEWRGPAFFDFDHVSIARREEGARGALAIILMSASAVSRFTVPETSFSLDASIGRFASYDESGGDVDLVDFVIWSESAPGADFAVHSIVRDADDNMAFYGEPVTPQEIFSGVVATDRGAGVRETLPSPQRSY